VRFLIDEQLPPALARWIAGQGHEAQHVNEAGLAGAKDRAIWDYATRQAAIIVTKDEDFVQLSQRSGEGQQLVWITSGNTRRQRLLERMEAVFPQLVAALEAGERIVELR
jgi:predicted nuclease of predicted toxin-antitoxin system